MDATTIQLLPADRIVAGNNDRKVFKQDELEELAESIATIGLLQAIVVQATDTGWRIVAGERRYRAMMLLGWTAVPATVVNLTPGQEAVAMAAENLLRADLLPSEEGRAYQKVMAENGITSYAEVAKLLGISWNRVEAKVRLLRLCPEALQAVDAGSLAESWAWGLDGLDNNRQRLALAAIGNGVKTHAEFRALCAQLRTEQDEEPLFDAACFMQVQDYVIGAQRNAKVTKTQEMRRLLAELATYAPPDLAARAAALLAG